MTNGERKKKEKDRMKQRRDCEVGNEQNPTKNQKGSRTGGWNRREELDRLLRTGEMGSVLLWSSDVFPDSRDCNSRPYEPLVERSPTSCVSHTHPLNKTRPTPFVRHDLGTVLTIGTYHYGCGRFLENKKLRVRTPNYKITLITHRVVKRRKIK